MFCQFYNERFSSYESMLRNHFQSQLPTHPALNTLRITTRPMTFSFPEAALLLVSTKNRDLLPLAKSNTGSPRFTDFPSLCACSESTLTNLIGSGLNLLCLQSHSKTECRWTRPEVAILGADQKERGLWGREWPDETIKVHLGHARRERYKIIMMSLFFVVGITTQG